MEDNDAGSMAVGLLVERFDGWLVGWLVSLFWWQAIGVSSGISSPDNI